jgi:hypothetical protein
MLIKKRDDLLVECIRQNCRNLFPNDIPMEILFFMICLDRCFLFQFLLQIEKLSGLERMSLNTIVQLLFLEFLKTLISQEKT